MAQFEADLADENADEEEVAEEKTSNKEGGEETWLKSDRDYSYDEVKYQKDDITSCRANIAILAPRSCL